MQTLWNKGTQMPQEVKDFTVGNDLQWDKRLAVYDVKGSAAHVQMLGKTGLLTAPETEQLLDALKDIERSIREGTFHIPEGTEDIHSAIELELTEKLGPTGKKIHAGRSRNDQVLTDIHLYLKDVCRELAAKTESLFQVLQIGRAHV